MCIIATSKKVSFRTDCLSSIFLDSLMLEVQHNYPNAAHLSLNVSTKQYQQDQARDNPKD